MKKIFYLSFAVFIFSCNSDDKILSLQKKVDSLENIKTVSKNYDPLYKSNQSQGVEIPLMIRYYFQALFTKNYDLLLTCMSKEVYRYHDNFNPFDFEKFKVDHLFLFKNVDEIEIKVLNCEKLNEFEYVITFEENYIYLNGKGKTVDTFTKTHKFILDEITAIKAIYGIS